MDIMLEDKFDEEARLSLVSIERLYLAEKLEELTYRHLELAVEKYMLQFDTSPDVVERDACLKAVLKKSMNRLWYLRRTLDDMRMRDRARQKLYKEKKLKKSQD